MGQEITQTQFGPGDVERFRRALETETALARHREREGGYSSRGPIGGFEIEAWLVDEDLRPAPCNAPFLEALADPMATPELARFNIEINNRPRELTGRALSAFHDELSATWRRVRETAEGLGLHAVQIGILPTLAPDDLRLANMSALKRYQALNEQVLRARAGRPLTVDIVGRETLHHVHHDVMLESATTSFQIHLQVPAPMAARHYDAAIMTSAPMVALGANSPYLFGADLWDETRIPLFEQSVQCGGYEEAARGPLHRVGFGSGYAQDALTDCFEENLRHFPILLPMHTEAAPERFAHLRLHNGTIWRWNRPLLGFDDDGRPHLRIEHRVLPAGPTLIDDIANAAFFFGLVNMLAEGPASALPFTQAKDNFYQAARLGLDAAIEWPGGPRRPLRRLILHELLPLARRGLERLGIDATDAGRYLDIVERRVASGRTGAVWQRRFVARHGRDFHALLASYLAQQETDLPVHTWDDAC
ncbi:MAG: glutamate--cysteine ligase [Chromatiales bacterium]|jgi:gamma-glutamyl:cysteine ligase YbdK (ATP-grasp superfamily)|nr:glutamate--cysteine ligase [Chromatiales bacterium]MDX9768069.1 glutamate--cysteine ligase [Ectothiorhodospiraceae bacterium]